MDGDFPLLLVNDLVSKSKHPVRKELAAGGMELARKEGELGQLGFQFKRTVPISENTRIYAFVNPKNGQVALVNCTF